MKNMLDTFFYIDFACLKTSNSDFYNTVTGTFFQVKSTNTHSSNIFLIEVASMFTLITNYKSKRS